ncbi:MAG: SDR family oxidoreductase [Anaerolineae bacterium]|nr:SDR family oxidoreductase [Anaerolineae bacterium]
MAVILVTGAGGNVGAETVRLLKAAGAAVRAAERQPRAEAGVESVRFDFGDPATFGPALQGVEKLFLLRPPALADTRRYFVPVIQAAQAAGVRHIVFLSLLGAEKNKVVPHASIEAAILASGVPYTFLRPSFFMQNLSTTHRDDIRQWGDILAPAGRGKTSFIDVRDIAAVAAKTLTEPGHANRAYSLTGAEALDYSEVAQILSEVLGRRIVYSNPSIPRFVLHMRRRGLGWGFILVMVGIYTTCRLGLAGGITPDTQQLLGHPPLTLRQFAADYRDCWL